METPNVGALSREMRDLGASETVIDRLFHTFNASAEPFASAGSRDGL
jgi:hypothetical protein